MADFPPASSRNERLAQWWQGELRRDFTKREYALLGAVVASIGLTFLVVVSSLFG
jgi:hypothetical protein